MTYVFMTIRPIGIRLPKDFMNFVFVRAPTVVPKIHDYYITNDNMTCSTYDDSPVAVVQKCDAQPTENNTFKNACRERATNPNNVVTL